MFEAIYQHKREKVNKLSNKIIGSCERCKKGFIPVNFDDELGRFKYKHCSCKKIFEFKKKLLLSNIPKGRWDILDLEKRKILVTDPYDYKKKYSLYNRFIDKFIDNLNKAIRNSVGMFMFGPSGSGKTTAAFYIIANAVLNNKSCYYIYLKDLVSLLIDSYEDKSKKPLFKEIISVDILVVDELSLVGRVTPHTVAEFTSVCKNRVESQTSTILVSNYKDIDEISENFGAQMESLMLEGFQGIRFFSKRDLREVRNERLQSFFK